MGAAQHPHRQRRHHHRLLCWEQAEVPEGGTAVYRSATALTLSYWKDPAGHLFHLAALRQAGLYGAPHRIHLDCWLLAAAGRHPGGPPPARLLQRCACPLRCRYAHGRGGQAWQLGHKQ